MNRKATLKRSTKETVIDLSLTIEGEGIFKGNTGIGFFDHMLTLLTFYSGMDLTVEMKGDLETGSHHSIEDVGLVFGQALKQAIGDKKGIERYSQCYLPMDEVLTRCALDISGRPTYIQRLEFKRTSIGGMALEDVEEFFKSICNAAGLTLHIEVLYGTNDHHKVESMFKGVGRCLRDSLKVTSKQIPSTKGVLE